MKKIICAFSLVLLSVFFINSSAATTEGQNKLITIGTGTVTGVYYPAGGAICRLVNRGRQNAPHSLRGRINPGFG